MTAGREEALRLEAYLDTTTTRLPSAASDEDALDPDLRHAIDVLRDGIVRFHPSFRFVEELAARLAREAAVLAGVDPFTADTPTGTVMAFPLTPLPAAGPRIGRGVLVRGAISTVSLAGVALVAWRLGRLSAVGRRASGIVGVIAPQGHA